MNIQTFNIHDLFKIKIEALNNTDFLNNNILNI